MEMDNVEVAIKEALLTIPETARTEKWQGESPWSRAVKEAIVGVGRDCGWMTAANGCKTDEGKEWLYDVVWYQSDADHMTDVPLVTECEWGREIAVKEDFEKLLVARTKYRVMVFQGDSEESIVTLMAKMCLWITKFHRTTVGDRYLLAGWATDHWIIRLYVH